MRLQVWSVQFRRHAARAAVVADRGHHDRAAAGWSVDEHPNEAYTGRYHNPLFGMLVIAKEGDHLVASLANLHAVLEAFTEPETARVEMVPGSGEVLRFTFT